MTALYPELAISTARIEAALMALARFTDPQQPYTRLAFSQYDLEARRWLMGQMKEAGLEVRLDAAANVIGRRRGSLPGPMIMVGSHIDTVLSGGRFDGISGVVAALEVVRCLNQANWTTRHPLEVVSFTCEEATTALGLSPVGSKAMAGLLTAERVAQATGPDGRTVAEAIDFLGGQAKSLEKARRSPEELLGLLEMHVEQSGVLEKEGMPLGVVTAIAAPCRGTVRITGRADHSGATMMNERYDALCAAAEAILALERLSKSPRITDTVGTIGAIQVQPNMVTIIPGQVEMRVDVRSTNSQYLRRVRAQFARALQGIAQRRGVTASLEWSQLEEPVPIPERMQRLFQVSCQELELSWMALPSRASHDAARVATIAPIGMLFVPSKDGKSHCPEEWTDFSAIALGTRVLGRAILKLDEGGKRNDNAPG